jgi:non-heme chloroperoxidase
MFLGAPMCTAASRMTRCQGLARPAGRVLAPGRAGFKGVIDCVKAVSETDFTKDLQKFDVPTLILHGGDDQIVPIGASALFSSKIAKGATLKIYPGAPHGMCSTLKGQVNAELLAFLKE